MVSIREKAQRSRRERGRQWPFCVPVGRDDKFPGTTRDDLSRPPPSWAKADSLVRAEKYPEQQRIKAQEEEKVPEGAKSCAILFSSTN